MKKFSRLLIILFLSLVFIASVLFTYSNTAPVELNFIGLSLSPLPVSVLMIGSFVSGGLLGLLCGLRLFRQIQGRLERRRTGRRLQEAEQEVARLRSLTLRDLD